MRPRATPLKSGTPDGRRGNRFSPRRASQGCLFVARLSENMPPQDVRERIDSGDGKRGATAWFAVDLTVPLERARDAVGSNRSRQRPIVKDFHQVTCQLLDLLTKVSQGALDRKLSLLVCRERLDHEGKHVIDPPCFRRFGDQQISDMLHCGVIPRSPLTYSERIVVVGRQYAGRCRRRLLIDFHGVPLVRRIVGGVLRREALKLPVPDLNERGGPFSR